MFNPVYAHPRVRIVFGARLRYETAASHSAAEARQEKRAEADEQERRRGGEKLKNYAGSVKAIQDVTCPCRGGRRHENSRFDWSTEKSGTPVRFAETRTTRLFRASSSSTYGSMVPIYSGLLSTARQRALLFFFLSSHSRSFTFALTPFAGYTRRRLMIRC